MSSCFSDTITVESYPTSDESRILNGSVGTRSLSKSQLFVPEQTSFSVPSIPVLTRTTDIL